MENLTFEYVLVNPAGEYYNGNAYPMKEMDRNWTKHLMDAFRYTEKGVYRKKDLFPAMFSDCQVKKV